MRFTGLVLVASDLSSAFADVISPRLDLEFFSTLQTRRTQAVREKLQDDQSEADNVDCLESNGCKPVAKTPKEDGGLSAAGTLTAHSVGAELGSVLGFGGDMSHMMERQFQIYNELPLGEDALRLAGWTKHEQNGCDPALGFAWTEDASGPTRATPLLLYTTAAGQPAGIGTLFVGEGALPGPQQRWATQDPLVPAQVDGSHAQIDVAFRSGEVLCSGGQEPQAVGSVLTVNPKGESKSIPMTEDGSQQAGWYRGSCFDGMGWHRLLDTSVGSNGISWRAENLFPVVAMYHPEGEINAIFFASNIPQSQADLPEGNNNGWEPTSLSNGQMCANTCEKACTFEGLIDRWNTMHIYFRNHLDVTCEQGLDCRLPPEFQTRGACCSEFS